MHPKLLKLSRDREAHIFQILSCFPNFIIRKVFYKCLETKKSKNPNLHFQLRKHGIQSTLIRVISVHGPDRTSWRINEKKLRLGSWILKCIFLNQKSRPSRSLILECSVQVERENTSRWENPSVPGQCLWIH